MHLINELASCPCPIWVDRPRSLRGVMHDFLHLGTESPFTVFSGFDPQLNLFFICPTHHVAFTFACLANFVMPSFGDISYSVAFIAADVVVDPVNLTISWSTSRASTSSAVSSRPRTTCISVFYSNHTRNSTSTFGFHVLFTCPTSPSNISTCFWNSTNRATYATGPTQ